jgi:jumonji domain-containing protein 7
MGGARSVTSWHHDHYQNLYAVVVGQKTFRLLPPTDAFRLRLRRMPVASYKADPPLPHEDGVCTATGGYRYIPEGAGGPARAPPEALKAVLHATQEHTLWSSILPAAGGGAAPPPPPCPPRAAGEPPCLLERPSLPPPLEVTVGPGEMLYLPACWWHEVRQSPLPAAQGAAAGAEPVIAVNYWYDMRFNGAYAMTEAAEELAVLAGVNDPG